MSALLRKSFGDLKKRRSRTVFTIITIALAVAALGMFAVMPIIDETMESEVESCRLHNLRLFVKDLNLTGQQLNELEQLENVDSVEVKSMFYTRMYIGERRNDAAIIGVRDYSDQSVNVVHVDSGRVPGLNEVLTDKSNSRYNLYSGDLGDEARIYDYSGQVRKLSITGSGHTMQYTVAPSWGVAVFYTDMDTLHRLSNTTGFTNLEFELTSTSEEDVEATTDAIEAYLTAQPGFTSFTGLPEVRENNDYPGKEDGNDFASFFYVLTFLTVVCSVFLISNTMHTMMTEQRKEIAQMKAVGATKLQVLRVYLTTSFIMGGAGSIIGAVLGIGIAYAMGLFIAKTFYGATGVFYIYPPAVIASLVVGITITIIATLPALFKGLRVTAREGMQDSGLTANFGSGIIDKALMKMRFLPRSAQMGLRNITRKKGRSVSTILQVALAVGMFLAVVTFGHSLSVMVSEEFGNFTFDVLVTQEGEGGKMMTEDMQYMLEDLEGVKIAEPIMGGRVMIDGTEMTVFGYTWDTVGFDIDGTMWKGRWYTREEQEGNATVVVVAKNFAEIAGLKVGDTTEIIWPTGTSQFTVIGINSAQMNNGICVYIPINTVQDQMQMGDVVNGFVIKTDDQKHSTIDAASTAIEDEMMSRGIVVNNMVLYVVEEQNIQANQQIINLMIAVGSLIILITMIGLMSTLTMNVIERTKEIGILRCVGSSSWSVRSVFGTEGLVLSVLGWGVGIPIGYVVGNFLNYMVDELMHVTINFLYPPVFILVAGGITVVMTLIVIQPPLFRAVRFRPGEALRYE